MPFVGRMINFMHTRIEAAHDALRIAARCDRKQRSDTHDRQFGRERESLHHTARDAQTGKRSGAFAIRDAAEIAYGERMRFQQLVDRSEQYARMRLTGKGLALIDSTVEPQCSRAEFGRGIEGEDFQTKAREEIRTILADLPRAPVVHGTCVNLALASCFTSNTNSHARIQDRSDPRRRHWYRSDRRRPEGAGCSGGTRSHVQTQRRTFSVEQRVLPDAWLLYPRRRTGETENLRCDLLRRSGCTQRARSRFAMGTAASDLSGFRPIRERATRPRAARHH